MTARTHLAAGRSGSEGPVHVTVEQHYLRTPEGVFVSGVEDYPFFTRYLDVFDHVSVVARVRTVPGLPATGMRRADGEGVSFVDLTETSARSGGSFARDVWRATGRPGAFVIRSPGLVSTSTWGSLRLRRRSFGVEVVTDPAETFAGRAFGSVAARVAGPLQVAALRRQCASAAAAAYVTRDSLQASYPPGTPHTFHYSSIDLDDAVFARAQGVLDRLAAQPERLAPARLVFVGNLGRPFKGLDVLLDALARLGGPGAPELIVVGDGQLRASYQAQARELGIADRVHFQGHVAPGAAVFDVLAGADLMVLPSRREGLPRVVIEAMAVGLPCVSTDVSGAAELLCAEDIVPREDPAALAAKIEEFVGSRARRMEAAERNRARALDYSGARLRPRRRDFYRAVAAAARADRR